MKTRQPNRDVHVSTSHYYMCLGNFVVHVHVHFRNKHRLYDVKVVHPHFIDFTGATAFFNDPCWVSFCLMF